MKRFFLCLTLWVLMLLCAASSAEELIVQVSEPDGVMLKAGTYDFAFTLYNAGSERIDRIRVYSPDGRLLTEQGPIGSDERIECTVSDKVTDAELDEGAKFFSVRYGSTDNVLETAAQAALKRSEPDAKLEFTRLMPVDGFLSGDPCVITYRIENAGNIAYTDVTVTDAAGSYTGSVERIEPGKTVKLNNRFEISENAVSEAVFSAVSEWDASVLTEKADPETLTVGTASIDVQIMCANASATVGEKALLGAVITNTGTLDLRDVRLTGAYLGRIVSPEDAIPAGGSIELEREIEIRDTATFALSVTASTARGEKAEAMSEPVTVSCVPDESIRELYLEAGPQAEALTRKGDMPVNVRVKSASGAEIRNVDIMEETLGVLRHLDIVAGAAATEFTVTVPVEKKTDYVLYAVGDDAEESARVGFTVSIARSGLTPEPVGERTESRPLFGLSFRWVLTFAAISLAALLTLLIRSVYKENKEKKRRLTQKRQPLAKPRPVRKVKK